jgi:hypothetical protein
VRREPAGAGEFSAEGLVESRRVERTHERADQLCDQDAVARMAAITRRQKLHVRSGNRRDQLGDALGCRRGPRRVDDDEDLRLSELGGGEDRAQRGVLAGQTMIGGEHAMQRA